MQEGKHPSASVTEMNELILPNDTNTFGNLMGGRLLYWMDICSAMAAQKHSNNVVVTASVDNVSFRKPVKLGEVINIVGKVTRAFNSSLEVHLEVYAQNLPKGTREKTNEAYYTFVALDEEGRPKPVPALLPESEEEQEMYDKALHRRELRLILAGKVNAENTEFLGRLLKEIKKDKPL